MSGLKTTISKCNVFQNETKLNSIHKLKVYLQHTNFNAFQNEINQYNDTNISAKTQKNSETLILVNDIAPKKERYICNGKIDHQYKQGQLGTLMV